MLTRQAFYEAELRKLLQAEIDRLLEILGNGHGTPDYSEYRHQIGKIAGLRTAMELMAEADAIVSKSHG
jgi:hypothetical protein